MIAQAFHRFTRGFSTSLQKKQSYLQQIITVYRQQIVMAITRLSRAGFP